MAFLITSKRYITVTLAAGLACSVFFFASGPFVNSSAHADFLNPDATDILPPTNVGMTASWVHGASESSMSWTKSANAVSYNVYQYDSEIASGITGTSYQISAADLNPSATYTVTSVNAQGQESIPSNLTGAIVAQDPANPPSWTTDSPPPAPTDVIATPQWNLGQPRNEVTWQGNSTACTYDVYRDGTEVASGLWDLTYIDSDVSAGSVHSYSVTGINCYWPSDPESGQSGPASATALSGQPAFSATPLQITKVVPDDDSATVFFTPIAGATDYRIYDLSNLNSAKYAGVQQYDTNPGDYYNGKVDAPQAYSIEENGLNPNGADLVVEAVDKLGPFQKSDGFMGPGASMGTSVNGQGDPSDVPNVIARSQSFHVTMAPFKLTGSQAFQDTFRNEPTLQTVANDPALVAAYDPSAYADLKTEKNANWTITSYGADTAMTRDFFMGNHFMDTLYDGPTYDEAPFSHNNNATNVIEPNATADISGGKVLHVTMEVDGHFDSRRWTDILVGEAGDTLIDPQSPGKLSIAGNPLPTSSGYLFYWGITSGTPDLILYEPDPSNPGHSKQINLFQASDYSDGISEDRMEQQGPADVGFNGTDQDLDKRDIFDLYLSSDHYKVVETRADGSQLVREEDFPAGVSLPFSQLQVYYAHELYHTGNDRPEQVNYTEGAGSYWYDYRPYSDERHWDDMGFEVLPSVASIPATSSLIPASEAPDYTDASATPSGTPAMSPMATATPTPVPTPSPSPASTPTAQPAISFDLNGDGKLTLSDILLGIQAYLGSPNAAAKLVWPPDGDPKLSGLVKMIQAYNDQAK